MSDDDDRLAPCPFCRAAPEVGPAFFGRRVCCHTDGCPLDGYSIPLDQWRRLDFPQPTGDDMTKQTSRLREFVPVPEFLKKPAAGSQIADAIDALTGLFNELLPHVAEIARRLVAVEAQLRDAGNQRRGE